MKYTLSQKLDETTLTRFFEKVWNAEVSSDVEALYSLFQEIWENIDEDPNFEEYNTVEKAQLLRYYGYFLSHFGQAKNIPFYQERGKNLLTKSIDLFSSLNLFEKATEAEIVLGLCYFYEGAIEESETVYRHVSSLFEGNHLHPLYLRTRLNSILVLQWKGEYQKALEIIEEIEVPMEFCNDVRLLISYHTQAGVIYRGINQYDRAVYHYNKCIEISQQENNWLVVGKVHNNLAFLYKNIRNFDLANFHVEQAISIFRGLNHIGLLPHTLDTKAIIHLEEGKLAAALEIINEAVSAFQKGEDYAGLVDSLWNKSKVLLNLSRKEEAIETFTQLCQIAQMRIGEYAVKRYSKLFAEIIYIKQNGSLEKEVSRFKKSEIVNALRRSKYNFNQAAEILGISDSDHFVKMLNKEFPSIYEELGISHTLMKPELKKIQKEKSAKREEENPRQINKIELQDVNISFFEKNDYLSSSEIKTFYLSSEKMFGFFNIAEDVILAAVKPDESLIDKFVIAKRLDGDEYIFSRISHDKSLDIFYLLNGDEPFPLEEITIIGQVVGYCLFTDVDNENLVFKPLPVIKSEILK